MRRDCGRLRSIRRCGRGRSREGRVGSTSKRGFKRLLRRARPELNVCSRRWIVRPDGRSAPLAFTRCVRSIGALRSAGPGSNHRFGAPGRTIDQGAEVARSRRSASSCHRRRHPAKLSTGPAGSCGSSELMVETLIVPPARFAKGWSAVFVAFVPSANSTPNLSIPSGISSTPSRLRRCRNRRPSKSSGSSSPASSPAIVTRSRSKPEGYAPSGSRTPRPANCARARAPAERSPATRPSVRRATAACDGAHGAAAAVGLGVARKTPSDRLLAYRADHPHGLRFARKSSVSNGPGPLSPWTRGDGGAHHY
jgi:hypothetical protein